MSCASPDEALEEVEPLLLAPVRALATIATRSRVVDAIEDSNGIRGLCEENLGREWVGGPVVRFRCPGAVHDDHVQLELIEARKS